MFHLTFQNFQYISESTNTGGNTKVVTLITAKTCPCEGHQKEIVENYKSNKDSLGRNKLSLSAQRVVLDYKDNTKKTVRKKKYMKCEKDLNKTQDYLHNDKIPDFKTFPVLCIDGWTIIQQRIDGKENFTRNWEDYKNGFGVFTGDFFLGLEKIHRLTNDQPHELIIHLEKFNGTNYYARYKNFKIAGEEDKYKLLSLGSFSGNSTWDGMKKLPGTQFSTIDSDNDAWMEGNCAKERQAGWWFRKCALRYGLS